MLSSSSSFVLASRQCQCLIPITSITTSSAHCASPSHINVSLASQNCTRQSPCASASSQFESNGKISSSSSSGRGCPGGVIRAVDRCGDSLEACVRSLSGQHLQHQKQKRREMVGTISSWVLLPGLINAELLFGAAAATAEEAEQSPSKGGLVEKLLERSRANKAKYDQERLDAYYRRNFKDYFEFLKGGIQDKDKAKLTEAEKGILTWLEKNQ